MLITFMATKFNRYITTRLYYSKSSTIQNSDLLLKNLPITTKDIDIITFLHGNKLANIPRNRIIKNCKVLRDFNVELESLTNIIFCLSPHFLTVKHRIVFLHEMGVPVVSINLIHRLPQYMKLSVKDFKDKSNIPMEQNVMTNLLCHINDKISDPPPIELLDESLPLFMHVNQCTSYYMKYKLGINDIKLLTNKLRKYRSFRFMTGMLEIFKEEIGVDEEYQVKKHIYILGLCPDESKCMLENFKDIKIGTLTIREAIKKCPQILLYDQENIKNLLKSLKRFEVEEKAVNNFLRGLRLENDVFVKKMQALLKQPDIKVWCKNARILYFIYYEKVSRENLNHLRKTGLIKWANMHLLTSNRQFFNRFKDDDISHTSKGTYVKYILYKELGSDKQYAFDLLTRHPFWNRVPFSDIDNSLCFLKKNFSVEDICNNIHLVLYPWSSINKTLKEVKDLCKQNQNVTKSQLLAYCLYLLERNNHFTGDGIWNVDKESKTSLRNEGVLLEYDTSYKSNEIVDILNNKQSHTVHM